MVFKKDGVLCQSIWEYFNYPAATAVGSKRGGCIYREDFLSIDMRGSRLHYKQASKYSPSRYISFIPLVNALPTFHPKTFKRGVSSGAVHSQYKYGSTHVKFWMETAITLSKSSPYLYQITIKTNTLMGG